MCLFALITPPHPPHFCWSLWKQQPLTLGDVWVQVEDVWWLRQPLLHEHCALFLAASLMGFSSRPNLDHRTPTGVYCSYHCKWIQRKVWECCTNLLTPLHQNYLFFCTSFLHFRSLLMISAENENNLKQMSTSVAPPFCHRGRTWACIRLRKSSELPARKAFSNYQINPSYRKYWMFKIAFNQC